MTAERSVGATGAGGGVLHGLRSGEGPLGLLLVHGVSSTGEYFRPLISELDLSGLVVLSVDLQGHGRSATVTAAPSFDEYSDDLVRILDAAGIGRFVAVGHSFGGKCVQHLASSAGERMLGQVLVAPSPPGVLELTDAELAEYLEPRDLERLEAAHRGATVLPVDAEVRRAWAQSAVNITAEVLEHTFRIIYETSIIDCIRTVAIPTLVVAGRNDPFYSPALLRTALMSHYPQARMVVLDGGHELQVEATTLLAGLIEAFIAGLSIAPTGASAPNVGTNQARTELR